MSDVNVQTSGGFVDKVLKVFHTPSYLEVVPRVNRWKIYTNIVRKMGNQGVVNVQTTFL